MRTKKTMLLPLLAVIMAVCASIGIGGIVPAAAMTTNKDTFASNYFTAVGDNGLDAYVNDISYGEFTATNFSGAGVMVQTRNKTAELKDNTDTSNDTNPPLLNFPSVKYGAGAQFNGVVDISDNTASDTLMELAFLGTGDNKQAQGVKIIIEDADNPNKYIALFLWYGGWASTAGNNVLAAAAGTWEKTRLDSDDVYISEAGFDTENYGASGKAEGFYKVGNAVEGTGAEGLPDGCYLCYKEHGHEKTKVKLSAASENTVKVQFDNANGKLFINGVRIRDFKTYSADGIHYFDGFAGDKVKLSVSVIKTNKTSTDEFTKFCIMGIDGNSFEADGDNNISYKGYMVAPESGLIASGITEIPAPLSYEIDGSTTPVASGVTVTITAPDGKITENYSDATFDFDTIGTYTIEYFVDGSSVGTAEFATAVKGNENELSEITSFEVSDNLFTGKKISLADFTLTAGEVVTIESATVKIYKGEELIATETADADWTYTLTEKGDLTFKVISGNFSAKVTATVLPGLFPNAAIENGSVVINGAGDAVGLLIGENEFVITPNDGYKLASLTINGVDVTEEVVDGEYTFSAESAEDNITYTVVFEKLPTVTVTFTADGETLATVNDVISGTLFGEIDAPEIPEKENYDIVGWNIEDDFAITENVTAEAVYAVKTYTITFDTDGGTQIAAKQYTALETVEEFDDIPEKTGFVFDAWYLGTEKYVFGNKLTSDITLTAKYTVKKINVTVKSADFEDIVLTIDYNTAISADKLSEKSGYEFKGLFTDEALTKAYNGEKITADTILYASYAKKSGCGGNILGSGFEFVALITLVAAICVVALRSRKAKQN